MYFITDCKDYYFYHSHVLILETGLIFASWGREVGGLVVDIQRLASLQWMGLAQW